MKTIIIRNHKDEKILTIKQTKEGVVADVADSCGILYITCVMDNNSHIKVVHNSDRK